jgi:signal transduction histidine kinase
MTGPIPGPPSGEYSALAPSCPITRGDCGADCIYASILENINVGVIVIDTRTSEVIFRNQAVGILCPDPSPIIAVALDPGSSAENNCRRSMRVHGSLIGFSVYPVGERQSLILLSDIGERARLEAIAEAANFAENTGFIFSAIRHELGNPLNSMKMALTVLKRDLVAHLVHREGVVEYVDRAVAEVSRMETLLKALKSFSMFDLVNPETVSFPAFMKIFLGRIEGKLKEKGISVVHKPTPLEVKADVRVLQQVLLNVFNNAIDAVEGRGLPRIAVSTAERDGFAVVTVRDNGRGIPEKNMRNLMKPFFTTKSNGTGLGLVISRKLLAKMQSTIELSSVENMGTTVEICLPSAKK